MGAPPIFTNAKVLGNRDGLPPPPLFKGAETEPFENKFWERTLDKGFAATQALRENAMKGVQN